MKNDLDYFAGLFEQDQKKNAGQESETWDDRADRWGRELSAGGPFRRSMDDRIAKAAQYLRSKGLLGEGTSVVDIGCGPGRYAAEFAKTAGYVTGVDISARMVALASAYVREQGLENVSFIPCDFMEADVDKLGWTGKFDLVFSSITSAVGSVEGLEKSIKMSRGFCFRSDLIYWRDELEEQIARDVFQTECKPRRFHDWRRHYSLFNLLFLKGYQPETTYHRQRTEERGEISPDIARYYASLFTSDKNQLDENTRRVYGYLEALSDPDGTILQRYERWYAWILWDTRVNSGSRI